MLLSHPIRTLVTRPCSVLGATASAGSSGIFRGAGVAGSSLRIYKVHCQLPFYSYYGHIYGLELYLGPAVSRECSTSGRLCLSPA